MGEEKPRTNKDKQKEETKEKSYSKAGAPQQR